MEKYKFLIGLDTETVDLEPKEGSVVEIGIVLFNCDEKCQEHNRVVSSYQQLFKPKNKIPKESRKITGIFNRDVKTLQNYVETWEHVIIDWCIKYGDLPIVGHNLQFDRNHLIRQGSKFFSRHKLYFDTMLLLSPKRYQSLDNCTKKYLPKKNCFLNLPHHRAVHDATMACAVAHYAVNGKFEAMNEAQLIRINHRER